MNNQTVSVIVVAIAVMTSVVRAESLDDLLSAGRIEVRESSVETKALWDKLLTSLETNDTQNALLLAKQYNDVKDFVEPYQKTFTECIIQILSGNRATDAVQVQDELASQVAEKKSAIAEKKKAVDAANEEINKKKKEIDSLRDKRDKSEKDAASKEDDANKANAIGGALGVHGIGGIMGGESKKKKKSAGSNRERIADLEADIQKAEKRKQDDENAVATIEREIATLSSGKRDAADKQANVFRDKIASLLTQFVDAGYSRPAVALANCYLKVFGTDPVISKLGQVCIDCQKAEAKAIAIVNAVAKPVSEQLADNRLWSAKAELDKANDLIKQRITDQTQVKFISREISRLATGLESRIKKAEKELAVIFEVAQRDVADGQKRLDAFAKQYPDYQNLEQDKIKIGDLRAAQIQKKFDKKLAAIQEVIANDPAEAKAMIKKLMESEINSDESSIMSSRITALKRGILEKEVAAIRKEMDEAQSYLTTFKATYSLELKSDFKGENATASQTQQLSAGVENLIRARSVQAGAIKRLELLVTEETDNVTKSKLVGLLETQKAAVSQMDDSINASRTSLERANAQMESHAQNVRILTIGGIAVGLVALVALVAVIVRRKSGTKVA